MSLSDFEISKIAEIVAGKVGTKLDGKEMRRVVDQVVDSLKAKQANPEITGATCGASPPLSDETPGVDSKPTGLYDEIERTDKTRLIIAAFGKNRPGVVASITEILAKLGCNIEDMSQTIMQEFFSMIMVVDIGGCTIDFSALSDKIKQTETQLGMKVYVMHEDIFRYMHRI